MPFIAIEEYNLSQMYKNHLNYFTLRQVLPMVRKCHHEHRSRNTNNDVSLLGTKTILVRKDSHHKYKSRSTNNDVSNRTRSKIDYTDQHIGIRTRSKIHNVNVNN
jgi:hypothetical protein